MAENQENKVNISYEVLFDLVRREKDRDELQKLEPSFYQDLVQYLREKKQILKERRSKLEGSSGDQKTTERQIENITRLIRQLYQRREKKIIKMALTKSQTKENIVDSSSLLKEEQEMFNQLVKIFNRFRRDVLEHLVSGKLPGEEKEASQNPDTKTQGKTKMVRFLQPVPKFVGKELEVYGPFEEEDVASLPEEIADVLVNRGRAEEMSGE